MACVTVPSAPMERDVFFEWLLYFCRRLKPRLHQRNMLSGNKQLVARNMLRWCKRGFSV